MNGSGITFWSSGIWIIPLVLLATLGGFYLLVRHWRTLTMADLKKMRSELRRLHSSRMQLTQAMAGHSVGDPEPYGSRVAAIHNQIDHITTQITELEVAHVHLQERFRELNINRPQNILGAPFLWYQYRQEVQNTWKQITENASAHEAARASHQSLARLGLDVAAQARQLKELEDQTSHLLGQLRSHNLQGAALQEAVRQTDDIRSKLAQVPVVYLTGDEHAILEQSEKTSVTQVHQLVANARPVLEEIHAHCQNWQQQYANLKEKITALERGLAILETALDNPPPALALNEARSRYLKLAAAANQLQAGMKQPILDQLLPAANDAEQHLKSAQELSTQLKRSRGQLASLEQVLPELSTSIKRIATQFAALGTSRVHPVIWNEHSARLTSLSQQVNALGSAQKSRTPEQLEQDLVIAARLNAEQKSLAEICQQVADQHHQILELLASSGLSLGTESPPETTRTAAPGPATPQAIRLPQWMLLAQQLLEKVNGYDPENWPRMDSVATLPAELTALAAVYQSLAPVAGKTEPIQETEIAQRLEAVRQLASDSQAMRVRLSNIQKRLNEIQLIEVQTQEKLERTQVLFHQVSLLVGSNPYLSQVAGQEPARLKQNLEMLAEELAQAQSGVIERKAKNITNLVSRTESMANQWLDALNEDIRLAVQELSASLAALDEIAALEEPAVDEGHRLLSAGPAMGTGDARQKASFTLNDLVGEMKRRSDYWQALEASSRALTDIQNPILEASQQVNQARQNVLDQLIEVSDWIKQTHGYPPTGENLSQERQELNRLDGQRTALKRQRLRAIALVSQLGNLASRYQSAGEKVRQITERIARKSEEFERLAAELADFTQTWQSHWNARRDNALASSEIRELLEEADRELETIRQQCRAGKMTYEAALQALRAIHTRVRAHQIALDETHLMNINGRIITFRGGAG